MRKPANAKAYALREAGELALVAVLLVSLRSALDWPCFVVWTGLAIKTTSSIVFYGLFLHRPFSRNPRVGIEALSGQTAHTLTELSPCGRVRIWNETWSAQSETGQEIPAGRKVCIHEIRRLVLYVRPIDRPDEPC